MKVASKALLATALVTMASSCNSFLDINTNPNQTTGVTPNQLLANALTVTGAVYTNYNSYSSFAASYWTKSNAVSAYTEEQTYGYSSTYQQGLWTGAYDNLEDYELIRTSTVAGDYPNHVAIARIMRVYDFLLLVDQYGDIPYSQALKGSAVTTPQFDRAEDIYKDLVTQLKTVVTDIKAIPSSATKPGAEDVVYAGNMTQWARFANSLRLRILLRMSSTTDATRNAYVRAEMTDLQNTALSASGDGLITADVLVQPGYAASAGQQNPFYNIYGFPVGSSNTTSTYRFVIPTNYLINLFVNNSDPRVTQEYRPIGYVAPVPPSGTNPGSAGSPGVYRGGNLGEGNPPAPIPVGGSSSASVASTFQAALTGSPAGTFAGTFLRSPSQPVILMLSAENLFSKAEAELRGLITGDAKSDYEAGIQASFVTTFRNSPSIPSNINGGVTSAATSYSNYMAANTTNGLVAWAATDTRNTNAYGVITTGTRPVSNLEKIITQKWLAENTFASTEGWDDFRRLSLPNIPISQRAGAGKFPTRLLYPQLEINTNKANVPVTTTQYDLIFWDPS